MSESSGPTEINEEAEARAAFAARMRPWLEQASARGFPPWLGPIAAATPLNATPYVAALTSLRSGNVLAHRSRLVVALVAALDELRSRSVMPVAALIGGSVLDAAPEPGDLDCVIFYAMKAGDEAPVGWLKEAQSAWRSRGLDARLIPADTDPLMLIKATSFFTSLYARTKTSDRLTRGLVLIDCLA